jgi:hypothetical protein
MTSKPNAPKNPKDGLEGEGSYSGTRAYNKATKDFVATGKADKAARDASRALDSDEAAELEAAEAKGKAGDPRGIAPKPKK